MPCAKRKQTLFRAFSGVEKVILLRKSDFDKLSEDISPDYPFLQDNRHLLSADPGGLFHCLMVRAEGQAEHLLISQRRNTLYLGYGKDYRKVDLKGVPIERIVLEDPKVYQERAAFHHRPRRMEDIMGEASRNLHSRASNGVSGGADRRSLRRAVPSVPGERPCGRSDFPVRLQRQDVV